MKSLALHDIVATPDATAVVSQPVAVSAPSAIDPIMLAELYQATLGRAPDASGIGFFAAQVSAGASLQDVATQLVNSAEFTTTYGTLGDAQLVGLLYQNLLHRAADVDGFTFWMTTVGNESRGQAIVDFITSANSNPADLPPLIGQPTAGSDPLLA